MVLKIYEIENKGKGIITTLTPSNLLLLTDSNQGVQTWEDTLNKGSNLNSTHTSSIIGSHYYGIISSDGGFMRIVSPDLEYIFPNASFGRGYGNVSTDNSLKFYSDRTEFLDSVNDRGIEYSGDYEANFLPRTLITKQYVDGKTTGSETKINSGITTTVTGNGTIPTPYVIEENNNQKILTYPGSFTGINYTLTDSDFDNLIFINNGATNVTITVSTGLMSKFYAAFIQQGTGTVTFVTSGTTISTPVGLKIKGQNYQVCLDKVGATTNFHLTGNTII